jgi:hypothetical protein
MIVVAAPLQAFVQNYGWFLETVDISQNGHFKKQCLCSEVQISLEEP